MADYARRSDYGVALNENDALIIEAFRKRGGGGTHLNTREIALATGLNNDTLNYNLPKLADSGILEHVGRDSEAAVRGSPPKEYKFKYGCEDVYDEIEPLLDVVQGEADERKTLQEEVQRLEKRLEKFEGMLDVAQHDGDIEDRLESVREVLNKDNPTDAEIENAEAELDDIREHLQQLEGYVVPRLNAVIDMLEQQLGDEAVEAAVKYHQDQFFED